MIADLAVPFRDARAADLGFRLATGATPPRPALARLEVTLGDVLLELRILGGSHEVRARWAGTAISEVVACDAPGAQALPRHHERAAGGGRYRFGARSLRLGPAALRAAAEDIATRVGASPHGIVGGFPGHPAALTALLATARGAAVRWQTWHLYPGCGEMVRTTGVLLPVQAARPHLVPTLAGGALP